MSSEPSAVLFYGANVPREIVDRINQQRAEDPSVDHGNDEGFVTLVEQNGLVPVWHGMSHNDALITMSVASFKIKSWWWADKEPVLVDLNAIIHRPAKETERVLAFLQSIGCDSVVGWHLATHY